MPREYRSLTPEERARIADGNRLNRARRLRAESPGLTAEQLILCVAPECSDADVGRLAALLTVKLSPTDRGPEGPKGGKPTPAKILNNVAPAKPRRIVRKGHEMS
jgi:hypothetical protein